MPLSRLPMFLASALCAAAPLVAQVPHRQPQEVIKTAPRLMVANPYSFTSSDSATALQVGDGMRARVEKNVGAEYQVISRADMNHALVEYAYPADAMLPTAQQRQLAGSLNAKGVITATLSRTQGGALTVTARFTGINDDVGNVVTVTQKPNQAPAALGEDVSQALQPAIRTYDDAKACMDLRGTNAAKANTSADKAIQTLPTHGLAHWCQAVMLLEKKNRADSLEASKHLHASSQGDPLALPVWNQVRIRAQLEVGYLYNKKTHADSVEGGKQEDSVVSAYKQMLIIAPTNQPLREEAFKAFIGYGHPDAAQAAAEEGLRIDPTNADLYDLLSNACVYRENYKCAVDALEQVAANDSTKADSSFFLKITVMAAQQPDTARLLKWSQRGYRKYPTNLTIEKQLLNAYNLSGMTDSAIAITKDLMVKDPAGSIAPALAAAQTLQGQKQIDEAMPFLDFVAAKGDANSKQAAATVLLNGGLPFLQPPQDFDKAGTLLRKVTTWADPAGRVYPIANYYLGLSILQQIAKVDPEAEKQKSCDLAKKEEGMAADAAQALKGGASYKPDDVAKFQKYLDGLKPRVASMQKAYCK